MLVRTTQKATIAMSADKVFDTKHIFSGNFASGNVYLSNLSDRILAQSFRLSNTEALIRTLVCGEMDGETCRRIFNIKVLKKDPYSDTKYQEVFESLLFEHNLLCIAIRRAKNSPTGSILPYIYTCPAQDTVVYALDTLFVIGSMEQFKIYGHQQQKAGKGVGTKGWDAERQATAQASPSGSNPLSAETRQAHSTAPGKVAVQLRSSITGPLGNPMVLHRPSRSSTNFAQVLHEDVSDIKNVEAHGTIVGQRSQI